MHDEFIFHLHDTFFKMYGIEIANIRIESFKIMNHALADNISQQAIITAQVKGYYNYLLKYSPVCTLTDGNETS